MLFLCSDLAGNITGAQYVIDGNNHNAHQVSWPSINKD